MRLIVELLNLSNDLTGAAVGNFLTAVRVFTERS